MLERSDMISTLRERYDVTDLPSDRVLDKWDDEYCTEVVDTLMHHVIHTKKQIGNPFGFMKVSLPNWKPENTQPRKRKKKREMPVFMQFAISYVNTAEEPFIVKNELTGEVKINGLTEEMIKWAWNTDRARLKPESHMKFFWVMVACNHAAKLGYKPSVIYKYGCHTSLMYEKLDFGDEEIP